MFGRSTLTGNQSEKLFHFGEGNYIREIQIDLAAATILLKNCPGS